MTEQEVLSIIILYKTSTKKIYIIKNIFTMLRLLVTIVIYRKFLNPNQRDGGDGEDELERATT